MLHSCRKMGLLAASERLRPRKPGLLRIGWLCALLALGPGASCTLIVDADQYKFGEGCTPGREGCKCTTSGQCLAGLQCRVPGLCVDPDGAGGGSVAEAGSSADAGDTGDE
jgi:hypothetical protein